MMNLIFLFKLFCMSFLAWNAKASVLTARFEITPKVNESLKVNSSAFAQEKNQLRFHSSQEGWEFFINSSGKFELRSSTNAPISFESYRDLAFYHVQKNYPKFDGQEAELFSPQPLTYILSFKNAPAGSPSIFQFDWLNAWHSFDEKKTFPIRQCSLLINPKSAILSCAQAGEKQRISVPLPVVEITADQVVLGEKNDILKGYRETLDIERAKTSPDPEYKKLRDLRKALALALMGVGAEEKEIPSDFPWIYQIFFKRAPESSLVITDVGVTFVGSPMVNSRLLLRQVLPLKPIKK